MELKTPVLFLIFNRPDTTEKVFNAIKEAKPLQLFIAADGPIANNSESDYKCSETRKIIEKVDWECNVKKLYLDDNLGCRIAISSAIDWFFENVDEGIILEDDCVPSKSFFWFCQEMLEKYRDEELVMQINGTHYLNGLMEFKDSYYFSKLISCWGWATWKKAWSNFDAQMSDYHKLKKDRFLVDYYNNNEISKWMGSYLDEADTESCGIWSTQWAFGVIKKKGLSVTPTTNMIQNIGFDKNATTGTAESFTKYSNFIPKNMNKIVHPAKISYDGTIDSLHFSSIIKITDPRVISNYQRPFKKIIKNMLPGKAISLIKKFKALI